MLIPPWRATCIQMRSRRAVTAPDRDGAWPIIARNIDDATRLVRQACNGPDSPRLVVLPEFAFTGPPQGGSVQHWIDKACTSIPGPITAPLQALAVELGIFIGGNLFEVDEVWPGRYFNTCFLVDPRGDVVLRFRRLNTATFPSPHDFIDAYVARHGAEAVFPVVETELGRLAMIACGEIAVPEVARALMMRGAEVILHPTNEVFSPAQEAAKVARAAENMAFVLSANVAGGIGFSADGSVLGGRSRILDFHGDTLAYEEAAVDSVAVSALIDVEALRAARRDLGMANTLLRTRWDLYAQSYAGMLAYPSNQFLASPMPDAAAARPACEAALANLIQAGIVLPAARLQAVE